MKLLATLFLSIASLMPSTNAQNASDAEESPFAELEKSFPALEAYNEEMLLKDVWNRPELSQRDRSIVTLSVLVSRNQLSDIEFYLRKALDSGVSATEISELITHLAFYTGWANGTSAATIAQNVFSEYSIPADALPSRSPELSPIDQDAERIRQETVADRVGEVGKGLAHYTTSALFQDLWRRPGLAPRDRSLVTVSALVAIGQFEQVPFHLAKAMNSGLTSEEASEMLTHLAFYAGWPNAFSSVPIFKKVLQEQGR